ncbi:MAG: hypothetical protein COA58_02835 [Bacteroidetes bacterium]|nr:MAG: hypothetical protein COA58_02835 [Bacteroidota bacterium]
MKLKMCILAMGFWTCTNTVLGQERERMPVEEVREIIQLAIDLPELQEYYHIKTDSSRIPLIIAEYGLINSKNMKGINKFGNEIIILNESEIRGKHLKNYLQIGDWTYVGNTLRLQLSYTVEGIIINYMFVRKDEKWIVENSLIMER